MVINCYIPNSARLISLVIASIVNLLTIFAGHLLQEIIMIDWLSMKKANLDADNLWLLLFYSFYAYLIYAYWYSLVANNNNAIDYT